MQRESATLPSEGYVRLKTILHVIPVGKTTWWEGVARGRFPQPVKLGSRTTVWSVQDIRDLISQIAADSGNAVVRAGVRVTRGVSLVRGAEGGGARCAQVADQCIDQPAEENAADRSQ